MKALTLKLLAASALGIAAPVLAQDVAAGARIFRQCSGCHAVAPGKPSGVGPNLAGVVGRMAGTVPGFSYSPAMVASGIVWKRDKLDAYLTKPQAAVRGNRMPFFGLASAKDRADLIAYLETLKK